MTIRVGYTAIEVILRRKTSEPKSKVGWLNVQSVVQELPAAKVSFAATQVLVKQNPPPSPVIPNISMDVAIAPSYSPPIVHNMNMDVLIRPVRPAARISNLALEVMYQGVANSQFSWMGIQALHSITPAVQANFTWMGLQFLVPAGANISTSWMGIQALVDINSIDDIPDYMNFGSIFDAIPGEIKTSDPITVTGMTPSVVITLYSDSDITISKNGIDYFSSVDISVGDTITLRKEVVNVYNQAFRLFVSSDYTGEQEVGIWQLPGPSGTYKYDQYLYQELGPLPWVEYKKHDYMFEEAPQPIFSETSLFWANINGYNYFQNHQELFEDAPMGDFIANSEIPVTDAPLGKLVDNSPFAEADAPTGDQGKFNTYYPTKYSFETIWYSDLIAASEADISTNFIIVQPADIVYWDYLKYNTIWYSLSERNMVTPTTNRARWTPNIQNIRKAVPTYMMMQHTDFEIFNSYKEVWENWLPKIATPEWVFVNNNRNILATAEFLKETVRYGSELDIKEFWEAVVDSFHHIKPVDTNWWFIDENKKYPINLDKFKLTENFYEPDAAIPEYAPFVQYYGQNVYYTYEHAVSNLLVDLYHEFGNDSLFESVNYVRQGGFQTVELAEDAATSYPGNITVIYQQPEGTYTYDVIYNTALWCGEVPTNPVIRAVAWYLGGG